MPLVSARQTLTPMLMVTGMLCPPDGDHALGDQLPQPFGGGDGALERRLGQNHGEFLAAQAPDDVGRALVCSAELSATALMTSSPTSWP